MTSTDIGAITVAVVSVVAVLVAWRLSKLFRRDRLYIHVPPGAVPASIDPAHPERGSDRRVRGGQEYRDEVPVAFSPPRGLTPGLVGTVVDGVADPRDITATIVDLAARGWLKITALGPDGHPVSQTGAQKATDWLLTRAKQRPSDPLTHLEALLLDGLFSNGTLDSVQMSQLTRRGDNRIYGARDGLYNEVVRLGWYRKRPDRRSNALGCLGIVAGAVLGLALVSVGTPVTVISGLVAGIALALLGRLTTGRVPRTATGTAVRIQALGFKKYLATAEASQFSFEEAAGIFSRYLPYAIVFGVADHWAKVFKDLATQAQFDGNTALGFDFDWIDAWIIADAVGDLGQLAMLGDLDGLGGLADLADVGGMLDVAGGLGDIGDVVSSAGDFVSSIDFGDFGGFDF